MSTVFRRIITSRGMSSDHQNQNGWFYSLLAALDAYETANPSASVYVKDEAECLRRLESLGVAPWVRQQFAELFGARGTERV